MEQRMIIEVLGILCLMVIVSIMFLTYPRDCEIKNNEILQNDSIEVKKCYEVVSN